MGSVVIASNTSIKIAGGGASATSASFTTTSTQFADVFFLGGSVTINGSTFSGSTSFIKIYIPPSSTVSVAAAVTYVVFENSP